MSLTKCYFVPTDESLSWLGGRIELPATVLDTSVFNEEGAIIMGLDIGGLWEVMPIGGLGTEVGKLIPGLLIGNDGAVGLDEEPAKPSRAAIICARSW